MLYTKCGVFESFMSHGDDKTESVSKNDPSFYVESSNKLKKSFVTAPRTTTARFSRKTDHHSRETDLPIPIILFSCMYQCFGTPWDI